MVRSPHLDPGHYGLDYLYTMRSLALKPDMVNLLHQCSDRTKIYHWVGSHIDAINTRLNHLLQACHGCFHPWERPTLQIFAAPLSDTYQLEGICNLHTRPITLLIDVGRAAPEDWLALVAHEYAHARAAAPGHHHQFAQALAHLCLGLGYEALPWQPGIEVNLRAYPYTRALPDPLSFWRGEQADWRSRSALL